MKLEQIRAGDAKALLANPVFKGAIESLTAHVDAQQLSTDPDDKEKCARLIVTKQLLVGIVREITKYVENGQIVDFELAEIEQRKKTMSERVFRR